jgi:hypothetical protein
MSAWIVVDGMHKGNRRFPLEPSLNETILFKDAKLYAI